MAKTNSDCGGFKPNIISKKEFDKLAPKKQSQAPKQTNGGKKK